MLRAIILVLVLFVAVGTIVPIATDYAEAGAQKQQLRKKKKKKRYKRYRKFITNRYIKSKKRSKRYRKSSKYKSSKRYKKPRRYKKTKRKYSSKRRYKKSRRYRSSKRSRSAKRYRSSKRSRSAKRYRSKKRYRSAKRYRSKKRYRKARVKRTRRYSKKWWRNYRAKVNRRKALAKRKRNMRLRRIRLAKRKAARRNVRRSNRQVASRTVQVAKQETFQNGATENQNNSNVRVGGDSLSVVATAMTAQSGRKDVAGVSTTVLRRTVIDQMIREQGWVENDFEKYVEGKKVFVVVAKAPGSAGNVKSRIFYFAESKGQIYSLSTVAPNSSSTQIADQTKKLVKTLQTSGNGSVQSAKKD